MFLTQAPVLGWGKYQDRKVINEAIEVKLTKCEVDVLTDTPDTPESL